MSPKVCFADGRRAVLEHVFDLTDQPPFRLFYSGNKSLLTNNFHIALEWTAAELHTRIDRAADAALRASKNCNECTALLGASATWKAHMFQQFHKHSIDTIHKITQGEL